MVTYLEYLAQFFVFAIGVVVLAVFVLYIIDRTQRRHAIRRNFPVIGRFRDIFEHLGVFFRTYFFALDREEMPFNRAERSWVYRAAKNLNNVIPFGSTRDLRPTGTVIFANTAYPTLSEDAVSTNPIVIGPNVENPYSASSFFHISALSYGAISRPAVLALSNGARLANVWLNTGEGGLTEHHLSGGADLVFQIGTAKYGVRHVDGGMSDEKLANVAAHEQVKMFEIKLSQGAKPGKGGILPGAKVTEEIARIRGIEEGKDSISPNRHPEIENTAQLLDFVNHVRSVTKKPTGFKSVIGSIDWIEEVCETVIAQGDAYAPDFITVDSADGGSGAAPMSLIDTMGLPIKESLPLRASRSNPSHWKRKTDHSCRGRLGSMCRS